MGESEDGGRREKVVGVHHKLEIDSGRATSGKTFELITVVAVMTSAAVAVTKLSLFHVALILLPVDPIDDVLVVIM